MRFTLIFAGLLGFPLAATAAPLSDANVWPIASGQGHCGEAVAFVPSSQFAQRKTSNVCTKPDNGKTGSMPAADVPPVTHRAAGYDRV